MASYYTVHWYSQSDEDSDYEQTSEETSDTESDSQSSEDEDDEDNDDDDDDAHGPLPSLKDVEIVRESVCMKKQLGEGYFGKVYKGKIKEGILSYTVAIKTLKPGVMPTDKFLDEAKTMHKLEHDNLVELIGVCTKKEPILLITEYMCKGDLRGVLKKDKGSTINTKQLMYFASQIARGMDYLESEGFVHRDLRCANVLVGKHRLVKVADFGLARLVDDYDEYACGSGSVFPIRWTAPEAKESKVFTIQSDVWSFGVVLYEMITYGRKPKKNMQKSVVQKPKSNWPKEYFRYMRYCLKDNPDKRPTFSSLHNVFKDLGKK